MPISLYDLSVPTFLQTLGALGACLDRASAHFAATGADPEEIVTARLVPAMAPFHFQIEALTHHSVWGLEAVRTGVFAPPPLKGAIPFAELRALLADAAAALAVLDPAEVDSCSGKPLDIDLYRPVDEANASTSPWSPRRLAFTPETFLLSYSLPNFYFHTVTAYALLRTRGVPVGKGDFEGRLRTRAE